MHFLHSPGNLGIPHQLLFLLNELLYLNLRKGWASPAANQGLDFIREFHSEFQRDASSHTPTTDKRISLSDFPTKDFQPI
jgi:hypothetical protein